MPSSGLVKITPQYAGYVTRQTVSEGQHVAAGEPVYHISGEHYNGQGTGTLAAMSMSLKTQYAMLNRPGFPGECFICELRLPDHRFRWKHNKLFLLLPEEY
ncbi:HlyD family secretion protein, partial [Escherichia coli]|nr:HlyD family secretion protein [Escherichia coli]